MRGGLDQTPPPPSRAETIATHQDLNLWKGTMQRLHHTRRRIIQMDNDLGW